MFSEMDNHHPHSTQNPNQKSTSQQQQQQQQQHASTSSSSSYFKISNSSHIPLSPPSSSSSTTPDNLKHHTKNEMKLSPLEGSDDDDGDGNEASLLDREEELMLESYDNFENTCMVSQQ
jgi:hypothetical protein